MREEGASLRYHQTPRLARGAPLLRRSKVRLLHRAGFVPRPVSFRGLLRPRTGALRSYCRDTPARGAAAAFHLTFLAAAVRNAGCAASRAQMQAMKRTGQVKYGRVLLKLSGEALGGEGG